MVFILIQINEDQFCCVFCTALCPFGHRRGQPWLLELGGASALGRTCIIPTISPNPPHTETTPHRPTPHLDQAQPKYSGEYCIAHFVDFSRVANVTHMTWYVIFFLVVLILFYQSCSCPAPKTCCGRFEQNLLTQIAHISNIFPESTTISKHM